MSAVAILHLEDKGQDFLHLTIDEHGYILKCEPNGFGLWKERQIIKWDELEAGDEIDYKEVGKFNSCTILIKSIETLN